MVFAVIIGIVLRLCISLQVLLFRDFYDADAVRSVVGFASWLLHCDIDSLFFGLSDNWSFSSDVVSFSDMSASCRDNIEAWALPCEIERV